MKKYVFAGDWVLEKIVGIQRYTYQLLLELDKMLSSGEVDFDVEILIPKNVEWASPFNNIKVVRRGTITSKIDKNIWQQIVFPFYIKSNAAIGIDLAGAFPIWGNQICALHDCIREVFPETIDSKLYLKLYYFKAKIIANSKKKEIVTLTNDSKKEVQRFYSIPDERISIVTCGWEHMLGVEQDDSILSKLPLNSKKYFFSLGSKYKHKNFKWIIATAKKNPSYQFIITGTGKFSNNELELKEEVPKNVVFTGYISDGEIKSLMMNCEALIQPSLYEGFGLPPLEALSLGSKIIVSNQSSLPEIYREAAYYIDPYSDGCNLDELMTNDVGDSKVILQEYSWKRAVRQLVAVMEKNR